MRLTTFTSIAIGVYTLRRNPLRTVLSVLGIIIGVASLVAILTLSDGLEKFSRDQIERTTDVQTIVVNPRTVDEVDGILVNRQAPALFSKDDFQSLSADLGSDAAVTLLLTTSHWISLPDDTLRRAALVSALHPGSVIPPSLNVATGRFVEESDLSASTPVIVLSKGLASKFSPVDSVLLGKFVHVDGRGHRVIGLLEGDSAERVSRGYVALTQEIVRRSASERRQYPFMMIKASRLELVEPVRVRVNRWLEKRFGAVDRDFAVSVSSQRLAQVSQAMFVFKLGMGFITGISLLVGGIGIMNVLLASVSERTREIGVRRAAGARATDILAQFLAESVAIAGAGSILGVALGFLASAIGTAVIRSLTGAPLGMSFTWIPVLVGVGAASIVGIAFGIYPARRAAKLSPTDAIRYE